MPTRDRRRFVAQSIWYFLRQDYPNRELIVLDDGDDPVDDLVPEDARIRYVGSTRSSSLGRKRNLGCELARGELVAHWDDDDWFSADRLRIQVAARSRRGPTSAARTGSSTTGSPPATPGFATTARTGDPGSRAQPSSTGEQRGRGHRFADLAVGEDADFLGRCLATRVHAARRLLASTSRSSTGRTPCAQTSPSLPGSPARSTRSAARLGADRGFYVGLRNGATTPGSTAPASAAVTLAGMFMVWDGYGGMSEYLALGMARAGATVNVVALGLDEEGLSAELTALLQGSRPDPGSPVLWFAPPSGRGSASRQRATCS